LNLPVCVAACWRNNAPSFVVSTTADRAMLQVEVSRMYRTSEIGPIYADEFDDLITDPADCASIYAFISCAHYPESSAAVFFRNDGDGRLIRKIAQFCGNGGVWEMQKVVAPPSRQAVSVYRDGRWEMEDAVAPPSRRAVLRYRNGLMRLVHLPLDAVVRTTRVPGLSILVRDHET
jgi:hypothetical protein